MPRAAREPGGNNHIAEWFGHRVYPVTAGNPAAQADQRSGRCPFISDATGITTGCIKKANAKGVCTVSAVSNGSRQDWLVCPYRALDADLLEDVVRRLFPHGTGVDLSITPVTRLADKKQKASLVARVKSGKPTIVYFQNKLGGEISVNATDRSPEMSFDATMVELLARDSGVTTGKYGVFEIQTMDFHGTYQHAVDNLRNAQHLHAADFPQAVSDHPQWSGDRMEGPNIANVFKRTFYQMMFKFQIGAHASSAGCVFAIPKAVWDSWQRHLGAPDLVRQRSGTYRLAVAGAPAKRPAAWIYVFDLDVSDTATPNAVNIQLIIATDAASLSHYALSVAPDAALAQGGAVDNIAASVRARLALYLPELV